MQVFKCFFKIIRQNIGLILMYFIIFLVLTVAFSNTGGQGEAQMFNDSKIKVTVIDYDDSEVSQALTSLLYEHHERVDLENDTETLQDALYMRDTEYVLFIPQGYGQSVVDGDPLPLDSAQIPNSFSGTYVDRLVSSYISTAGVYMGAGEDTAQALANAQDDIAIEADVTITQGASSRQVPIYYYFTFLSYSIMLMAIFGICPVLMVFNRKEIAMRMNSSALPLTKKNVELGVALILFSAISYGLLILLGFIMYGAEMLTPGSQACMLSSAAFLLVSAAMAYLIGMLATSGNMLSAIGNALGLSLCFLGGVFVPAGLLSETMRTIAHFTPTFWHVHVAEQALGNATLSAATMESIGQSIGIELLFAVAFFAAALVVSRYKRRAA